MSGETDEELLSGGNVSSSVKRVGDTVRRPAGPWTEAVHSLLLHLESVGFDGAPRVLGQDEAGREILEYIPGSVPWPESHFKLLGTDEAMHRAGQLLRRFHDAASTFKPPAGSRWREPEREGDASGFVDERGTIICHNDPAAWNLVLSDDRWVLIDWDFAGPRPFIWDVAYAVIGLVPVAPDASGLGWQAPVPFVRRLNAFANGYRLEDRDRIRLVDVVVARTRSSYDHLRRKAEARAEPWVTLWEQGHGQGWWEMYSHTKEHRAEWERDFLEGQNGFEP